MDDLNFKIKSKEPEKKKNPYGICYFCKRPLKKEDWEMCKACDDFFYNPAPTIHDSRKKHQAYNLKKTTNLTEMNLLLDSKQGDNRKDNKEITTNIPKTSLKKKKTVKKKTGYKPLF